MLLLKFLHFISGYVSFTARGGFPERFINLCRLNKIDLRELRCVDSVIYACTDCTGYKKLRKAAKKSGMRVRMEKKHGLPFLLNRYSHRAGVLAGVCICAATVCILSTRIWSINVTGNKNIPSEQIIAVFEQAGVKKGISGNKVDIAAVENFAMQQLDELSWVNINFEGSMAVIEVREREKIPDEQEEKPSEIVAARDGQIVILRSFSGKQEQKTGNAVLKGDLLISGIRENQDLTVSFCRAKGYVVARTNRRLECRIEKEFTAKKTVGHTESYIFEFLSFSIPLGRVADNAYAEKTELKINRITLPFALIRCRETFRESVEINLTDEQAQLLAGLRFFEQCADEFRYLKTESREINSDLQDDSCTVRGNFVCLENIGREIPLEIEETADSQ